VALVVDVTGDALRCELHGQCEGLSRRVFRTPAHRITIRVGAEGDIESLNVLQQWIRSCPMDALRLVAGEPVHPSEHPEQ
jgi:ferredoxin